MYSKPFNQSSTHLRAHFRAPCGPVCVWLRKLLRPELSAANANLILQYTLTTLKAGPKGAQYPKDM